MDFLSFGSDDKFVGFSSRDLSENGISDIEENTFDGMTELSKLYSFHILFQTFHYAAICNFKRICFMNSHQTMRIMTGHDDKEDDCDGVDGDGDSDRGNDINWQ